MQLGKTHISSSKARLLDRFRRDVEHARSNPHILCGDSIQIQVTKQTCHKISQADISTAQAAEVILGRMVQGVGKDELAAHSCKAWRKDPQP